MGSIIAKEIKEAMNHGHAGTKPASTHNRTTTTIQPIKGTKTEASKEDEKKKKPGLTDEEWETIRSLSSPFS